jgi:hypothetical protein
MNDSTARASADYDFGSKAAFRAAKTYLTISSKFDLMTVDEVGNRLIAETRTSFTSWGETISIEFSKTGSKSSRVTVTSSPKRSGSKNGQPYQNRNQTNVNLVLNGISEELSGALEEIDATPKSESPIGTSGKDGSSIAPSLKTQYLIIGGVGLFIFALVIGVSTTSNPNRMAESEQSNSESISTPGDTPTDASSSEGCTDAQTAVTMVRTIFAEGTAKPNEVSLILNEAAKMWQDEAASSSGSKQDWLLKMSELSLAVDSYLLTGSPENGMTKFDQLNANMGIVNNFCS